MEVAGTIENRQYLFVPSSFPFLIDFTVPRKLLKCTVPRNVEQNTPRRNRYSIYVESLSFLSTSYYRRVALHYITYEKSINIHYTAKKVNVTRDRTIPFHSFSCKFNFSFLVPVKLNTYNTAASNYFSFNKIVYTLNNLHSHDKFNSLFICQIK